jgi:putative redox protein
VHGERFDGVPGRVTRVTLTYDVAGPGVEAAQVERAVELAVTKYCSVRDTLDPALPIDTVVRVHAAG